MRKLKTPPEGVSVCYVDPIVDAINEVLQPQNGWHGRENQLLKFIKENFDWKEDSPFMKNFLDKTTKP